MSAVEMAVIANIFRWIGVAAGVVLAVLLVRYGLTSGFDTFVVLALAMDACLLVALLFSGRYEGIGSLDLNAMYDNNPNIPYSRAWFALGRHHER